MEGRQSKGALYTHPHEANELLIADGFVGLVNGRRTIGRSAVAKTRVPAAVVVPALVAEPQSALRRATRALRVNMEKNNFTQMSDQNFLSNFVR